MTSEGQHRPGQEPDQVPPGAGGPAPYGDRQTQQDTGYGNPAAPDLGWAPPPPAGRPDQAAPAWAAAQDQPPAWGAAQVPQQGEPAQPGQWAAPQPAWAAQSDQPAAAWAAASVPGQPAGPGEPAQPAWAQPEQAGPAWAQPDSGARGAARVPQPDDAWPASADPAASGGWNAGQQDQAANGWATAPQHDEPAHSGGWNTPAQDDPARSGGWNAGTPGQDQDAAGNGGWNAGGVTSHEASTSGGRHVGAEQHEQSTGWNGAAAPQEQADGWGGETQPPPDDAARSGGWNAPSTQDEAPRSAGRASVPVPPQQQPEPAVPAWAQPDTGARGAAQVPQHDSPAADGWSTEDDPARSGGWNAARTPHNDPAHSGGWNTGGQDDAARSGGWNTAAPDNAAAGGWNNAPQTDERSPQAWDAAGAPAPAQWEARAEQQAADAWGGAAPAREEQRPGADWPAAEESAHGAGSWGAAAVPGQDDRPESGGWTPPEQPARATASVAVPGGPPAWGADADNPPQRAGADRPAVPDAEPWAAEEAWGRAEAPPAQRPAGDAWEPQRADEAPIYQPAPAPGISPANVVPLPPQEQRVPGASLAAAPPADYAPPAQFGGTADQSSFEPAGRPDAPSAYEPERSGWGPGEEPQSPAGPVVPGPRTSPEADGAGRAAVPVADESAAGRASASASVPLASRVMPPTDQALRPGATGAPQPRVYGRPSRPEPVDEPVEEYDGQQAEHDSPPRFADQQQFDGQQSFDGQQRYDDQQRYEDQDRRRFDEPERPSGPPGFGPEAPSSAPPTSPAAPPAFPGAIPAFADPASNNRPVNGTRPHGSADRPAEPFGAGPAGGGPAGAAVPGYGHPAHDPAHGGGTAPFPQAGPQFPPAGPQFPPAGPQFPPAGQQFPPAGQPFGPGNQPGPGAWHQDPEPEQGRFDAFKPDAEPKVEQPAPKVRNGRVLAMVLIAAVLILAIPLGLLSLLGKIGGEEEPAPFNPAVGSCVKQSGNGATEAACGEQGAFTVVSRVDAKEKCADPAQPHVVLPGTGADRVLCLKPAAK
ncbi:hypothetical protein ABZ754_11800 [Micromonospora purpureochromogenes]|uniref:LppU/SCO3897 family protein n=1 Tax=Micromonospora purpureochromogenes TaxID=47872 RepID=UPI00340D6EA2